MLYIPGVYIILVVLIIYNKILDIYEYNHQEFMTIHKHFCRPIQKGRSSLKFVFFRIPLCALLNQHLNQLATKFRATKFLKSVSSTCIPNYPDRNLPTMFVYFEGDMKAQLIGPASFRHANISVEGNTYFFSGG